MGSESGRALFDDRLRSEKSATIEDLLESLCVRLGDSYPPAEQEAIAASYRDLVGTGNFLPTTVILHHALTGRANLGGCLVWPLPADPEALFTQTIPAFWRLLQAGNGVGLDLSVLPPRLWEEPVTGRAFPGTVETLTAIVQAFDGPMRYAGLKRAAFMASLAFDHPDVFEFVTYKRSHELAAANLSVAVDDRYLEGLDRDGWIPPSWRGPAGDRYLSVDRLEAAVGLARKRGVKPPDLRIGPGHEVVSAAVDRTVGRAIGRLVVVSTRDLHRVIAETAHACGEPGLLNLGAINRANPTHPRYRARQDDTPPSGVGVIQTTAPCGEQPLLPNESCFLGSFNLSRYVDDGKFQFAALAAAVPTAVRFLDDLLERNCSGINAVDEVCRANRKIGIGVMGLADALADLELPYDTPAARALAAEILRTIHDAAVLASRDLARERGPFPNWPDSVYARRGEPPRRHATLTTIAPTGHISKLAGCSPSIEPYYRLADNQPGAVRACQPLLRKLEAVGLSLEDWIRVTRDRRGEFRWDGTLRQLAENLTADPAVDARLRELRRIFVTANEIPPAEHIAMLRALQPYVENGISKTVNLTAETTCEDVAGLMEQGLRNQLKGLTVFREGGERAGHLIG